MSSIQEKRFISVYGFDKFDEKRFENSFKYFASQMNSIGLIPIKDVIQNCKIFSIPDFMNTKQIFDINSQLFFNATMATGEILCQILLFSDDKHFSDFQAIKYPKLALDFKSIVDAALYIRRAELELELDPNYTLDRRASPKELENLPAAIKFMTEVMLVQHNLLHSRACRAFVEVIGYFFINSILIQNNNTFNIVAGFIDKEKNNVNFVEADNHYQNYLNFVKTVIILYNDSQLPDLIRDKEIITKATDFGIPSFFCSFVDFLTSMIMSPDLADYIYEYISNNTSEILRFENMLNAIFQHPNDLLDETNRQKLDEKDVLGLQSVLRFFSALFRQNLEYLDKISKIVDFEHTHPNENFGNFFVNSLLRFILSPVPASLKAECFNCLSSMQTDLWNPLLISHILAYDVNNEANYEGIISDIMKVEVPNKYYSIPQAFSHLISTMLANEKYKPTNFIFYHNFLYKIVLCNLTKWNFEHLDMKWEMLQNICKAWNNLLRRQDYLDICDPLYRSALTEPSFFEELIKLTNDDLCPVECLIEVYRLFLLLAWKENSFLRKALSSNEPLTAGIVNKISRDQTSIIKMQRCFLSRFMHLQIVSMELVEYIAHASPIIVQALLTKPIANSLKIVDSVINTNETEDINEFQFEDYDEYFHQNIYDKLERDEEGKPITLNARCFLLHILIKLGSSSFFVRHVCGFDQHDPPKSILATNLNPTKPEDAGILIRITKKLCEEVTHKKYPIFVAKSIQLLLIECKHDLTINATLDLLRSSLRSFFITQLRFLSDSNSSRIAIGCFLQIMALENANSAAHGSSLSGIIRDSFEYLMLPLRNSEQDMSSWKRNVLILSFIDRIEDDEESIYLLDGINDLTVAYLSNDSIIALMNKNKQSWPSTWMQIIFSLLEKVPNLKNSKLSQKAVGTCALIANAVLVDKKFGIVSPDNYELKKLLTVMLDITSRLFDYKHHESRIASYSLINTTANAIICNKEICEIIQEKENAILGAAMNDMKSEIPILRSISFAVVEALIPFASQWAFLPFLEQAIATTEDDWHLFNFNVNAACFSLSAKCRMFSKFLTSLKSKSSLSISHVSPDCKIIVNEALIVKLSDESFWKALMEMLNKSSENEAKLQTAADILSLFSVISIAFNDSEDLRIQLNWFLKKFQKPFIAFKDFESKNSDNEKTRISIYALKLYAAFFKLLSTLPNVKDLEQLNILDHIPYIFKEFLLQKEKEGISNEVKDVISQLLMSGIFVLMKISESREIFTNPLFGEEWRTGRKLQFNPILKNEKLLPLSIITSYLGQLLKEIKLKENENENKNGNDSTNDNAAITKDIAKKRSVASACLLLIWYHINRWSRGAVYTDMRQIKEQAKAFKEEPYISFTKGSKLDSLILKQLIE